MTTNLVAYFIFCPLSSFIYNPIFFIFLHKINRIMNIWAKIGLVVIVLHFIVGFGWLAYKLSPKKNANKDTTESIEENKTDEE